MSNAERIVIADYANDPCAASLGSTVSACKKRRFKRGSQYCQPSSEPELEKKVRNSELQGYTAESLRGACKRVGISDDKRLTKNLLICQILTSGVKHKQHKTSHWTWDDSQVEALECYKRECHLLLYGGPGSGKTEVLLEMACRSAQDARVLLLLYTNSNEGMALGRLRAKNTRRVYPAGSLMQQVPGVFACTLDKYADKRLPPFDIERADYSIRFQEALNAGKQPWERWDSVFVDECQDLTDEHERLIASLDVPKSVRAGDPRQELYEGSGVFSRLWREGGSRYVCCPLRYNHRSTQKVVDVLNAYSEYHFRDLHVHQRATRSGEGAVSSFTHPEPAELARATASCVTDGDFVILPVSVTKYWGTPQIVASIRQNIVDLSASQLYGVVLDGKKKSAQTPGTVTIANSYKLKGLECNNAVLVQGDVPYEMLNISAERLHRLLFVALSRCRDNLSIALSKQHLRQEGPLACIAGLLQLKTVMYAPKSLPLPRQLAVRDDLCDALLPCDVREKRRITPLTVADACAPDFVGSLVEGRVASVLGAPCCRHWQVCGIAKGEAVRNEMWIANDICHVRCEEDLRPVIEELVGDAGSDFELTFAQIKYSLLAGMKWTLGTNHNFQADSAAALGRARQRAVRRETPLYAHRSSRMLGTVCGITDIESEDAVIEVKHTCESADFAREQRQTLIYAALADKEACLYKSLQGFVQHLQPVSKTHIINLARAQLGLKQAQVRRRLIKPACTSEPWQRLMMAVDVETTPSSGELLEVGAVVFDTQNGTVLDVFHHIDPAITCLQEECEDVSGADLARYGFHAVNMDAIAPKKSREQFRTWAANWSVAKKVGFAGNDASALGLPESEEWRDARRLFQGWLGKNDCGRKDATRLEDAVAQLFVEDNLFVPHRALEDAVATAMITFVLYPQYDPAPLNLGADSG